MREVVDRQITEWGEIQLQRRQGDIYEIIYNGVFLMASYNDHSERVLARLAIENLRPTGDGYQILIGGLGMGFTLREVLRSPCVSRAFVVEIEKTVIDWNRRYFTQFNEGALDDPRTVLVHSDLFDFICKTQETYDAVLMDVDNGPNWLAMDKNRRLYGQRTLRRIKRILSRHGILTTWSAQEHELYRKRLESVFSQTNEIRIRTMVPKEEENLIYMAMGD